MEKIYHWKKSKILPILIYIIIAAILIFLWCTIEWNISGYLIIIPFLISPLLILFIIDFIKCKILRIKLDETTLTIKKRKEWEKKLNYIDILIVYIINRNKELNSRIQIIEKTWYIFTELNTAYIDCTNDLLQELYQKKVIICNIDVKDSQTNITDKENTIYRWPSNLWKTLPQQEPYAITRDIKKTYRWVPENETEQFEKKHNLINFTIKDKKEIH